MADAILVADIGGTNARFALAEINRTRISIREAATLETSSFETIEAAAQAYATSVGVRPRRACIAAAGPVENGDVDFTNLDWRLRSHDFKRAMNIDELLVINDFHAYAASIDHLDEDAFIMVRQAPGDEKAPRLVTGPGTGLGQALIAPTDLGARVISTEGGHVTMAPQTDREFALIRTIARKYSRVSVERLVCGRGILDLYQALAKLMGRRVEFVEPEEVTAAAISGNCSLAAEALSLYCVFLGRAVGDAVLATGARGGVYLVGGILPKIRDFFLTSGFVDSFLDKGRMRDYVDDVPVRLLIEEGAALVGASAAFKDLAHERR